MNSEGEEEMTPEDFIKSIIEKGESNTKIIGDQDSYSNLKLLFAIADKNETGKINFNQYVVLFQLLTTPESQFEMAFRFFDKNKDGLISKDEFKKVLQHNEHLKIGKNFDFDCDLMDTFFGPDGSSKLSYQQFSQFMGSLQEEIRKQEFRQIATNNSISAEQFSKMITSFLTKDQLSKKILENIKKLERENTRISYPEFDAYNRILKNMDNISQSIRSAAQQNQDGSISKYDFINAAKRVTGVNLSPLEVSIIFKIFASKDDEKLFKEDYEEFIKIAGEEAKRRQTVLDLWLKDEISKDGITQATKMERALDKIYLFTIKTLYGGFAGAVGATAVYPIDLIKTRLQNQREGARLYLNSKDCFQKIVAKEGYKGLYRGLGPQLIGVTPEKAIKLVVNDGLREIFGQTETNELSYPLEALAGCGAGASQVIFTNPIEIVKIRLQVAGEISLQTGEKPVSAGKIVRELGFSGLYKGASACFLRDIPFSGIYFPLYTALKKYFRGEKKTNKPEEILISGSIAGAVAASSTTPIDVVKTRLQVQARKGQEIYSNILDCFIKIGKQEGWKAYWKGILPRTLRSSPQFGITLLTYESLQNYWKPPQQSFKESNTMVGNVPVRVEEMEAMRQIYTEKLDSFKKLFGK